METNRRGAIPVIATVILLALSAVSMLSLTASASDPASVQMGNFSLTYDRTTSTLYNLTYANDNTSVLAANSILTAGKYASISSIGHSDVSKTLILTNVTLFATEDRDMFLMSTTNSVNVTNPSITVHLPSAASVVSITSQAKSTFMENGNSLMDSFMVNTVYKMAVSGGYIFFFANNPSTLTNNGMTIVFQNTSFVSGSSLIVGITPSASIKYSFDEQNQYLGVNPFTYNTATGQLTGSYLSMNFDSSTGIIRDFINVKTSTMIFSEIYSYGNGNFGGGFVTPVFPTSEPIVIGSVFYYANTTSIYQVHNNLALVSNFYLSNGTTVFNVASGMTITVYHPSQSGVGPFHYEHNYSNYCNLYLLPDTAFAAPSTIVEIQSDSFIGELLVHEGTVSVSGNTVEVTTSDIAQTTFISQPGYSMAQLNLRNQFRYAMQHGLIGAMVTVGGPGFMANNITTYYHNAYQVQIQNAAQNNVTLQFQANMQQGTNIMIFIPNEIMKNGSQIKLMYDNQEMSMAQNMNGVINDSSQTNASYYLQAVTGGTVIMLHIPHFTTHTLEITAISPPAAGANYLWLYIVIGVVVVAAGAATVLLLLRRKPGA